MISNHDSCGSYLQAQWRDLATPGTTVKRAVTISRQAGSGAKAIATHLAELLQQHFPESIVPWTVFDKELVDEVLKEHNLPQSLASLRPEDRVPTIEDMIEEVIGCLPPSRQFVKQTAETILKLAQLGNVILVGRGASVVTSRLEHVLHVRLVGSLEKRIERIRSYEKCDRKTALRFIRNSDLGRKRYLRTYFRKDIDDPLLYHLTLNTDLLTTAQAARVIADALLLLVPVPHEVG